jgi:hypothetical protein
MTNDSIRIRVIRRPRRASLRRALPRRVRTAAAITATAGLALLAAACSSSPSSAGSGGSPNAAGAASSPSASVSPALAFARCVRTHGVPDWPDPDSSGREPASSKQIAASSPRFPAAQTACVHLLPNGGQETHAQMLANQRNAVRFAGCMRTYGVPNWPDPTNEGGQPRFDAPAAGVDLSSPQVMAAAHRCQSLLHINLESIGAG